MRVYVDSASSNTSTDMFQMGGMGGPDGGMGGGPGGGNGGQGGNVGSRGGGNGGKPRWRRNAVKESIDGRTF